MKEQSEERKSEELKRGEERWSYKVGHAVIIMTWCFAVDSCSEVPHDARRSEEGGLPLLQLKIIR